MSGFVTTIAEITVDGLGMGMLLALLGAGITLVFGLGEILNLAQGVFAVLGAVVVLEATNNGVPILVAIGVGVLAVGAIGAAIDRGLMSSVYRSVGEERILVGIFVTLGLTLALEGLLYQRYAYQFSLPYHPPTVRQFGLVLLGASLVNIVIGGIVLVGLFAFLRYTYLGKAARTIASDEVGASLCGIDARQMRTIIFTVSAALAALAGILHGIGTNISAASGFELTVQALIVSIVGGVRDVRGTVAAGLGLGLVFTYANFFIGTYLAMIAMLVAAMLAIVARKEVIV